MVTLGIDIGGTYLRMGLVDRNYGLHAYEKHSVRTILGEDACATLAERIRDYLLRNGASGSVRGICLGFPATVDKQGERVLGAPNLVGFDGVNVKERLESALGYRVTVEKDVNLLLRCDLWSTRSEVQNVVGVYVGTGLGNAFVIDGKLHRGAHGVAGELGHVPFGDSDAVCGCGNRGCAEGLVAGKYLAALCAARFPDTHISALFTRHGDDAVIAEYVDRLARVIAAEVNILDPALLILGGGVIHMADFPRERLCGLIGQYVRKPLPYEALQIVFSESSDACGVIGAGICAWEKTEETT